MYQKYLVTGAAEPVGRLVAQSLADMGLSVRVLVPEGADRSPFDNLNIEVCEGQTSDKESLKEFFTLEDPRHSALIHAEEIVSLTDEVNLEMRRVNVQGTVNITDLCIRTKIARMVYMGSAYALNPGQSLENSVLHFDRTRVEGAYAKTKAEAGAYIIEKISLNKFNAVMLLPTFIIGPGFSEGYEMNKVFKSFMETGVPTISGGHAFVDVRDVADALMSLTENGQVGGCYILNGEYKSADEFFNAVKEISGKGSDIKKASKIVTSKSFSKFVDTYYRICKKDNPKQVYALFRSASETTVGDLLPDAQLRNVQDSLNYILNGIDLPRETVPAKTEEPEAADEETGTEAEAEAAPEAEAPAPEEEKPHVPSFSEAVLSGEFGKDRQEAEEPKEPENRFTTPSLRYGEALGIADMPEEEAPAEEPAEEVPVEEIPVEEIPFEETMFDVEPEE